MTRGTTSSTEDKLWSEIDASIDAWAQAGLVESSQWLAEGGRPLICTPLPYRVPGVWFDAAAVERVLRFFAMLRQLIGRHAGARFVLQDWQVRFLIAPVFGLKHPDGRRIIRTVWFEIPRKNGKSTLCSGLALYLFAADREPGAEVYAAAGDRDQANIVFRAAANMARACKPLAKKLGKRGIQRKLLEHPGTNSIFRALSSEGLRAHGLNVHGGVIDEVHVHKNPDVIDALETGVGAREQPLIVFITTADDGAGDTVYNTKREDVETLAGGHATDPTTWGVVFGADDSAEGFDAFSEESLRAANPGYGVTVMADYLKAKADEAKRSSRQLNRYLRLHLNVRTKQTTRWLDLAQWDAGGGIITTANLEGRECYAGLDLSSTFDLTALVLWFPPADDPHRGTHVLLPFFWLPEDNVATLERRLKVPLSTWAKTAGPMGPLLRLTEGNVVDYRAIRSFFTEELAPKFQIRALGYDRWNATETVLEIQDAGFHVEPVGQGYVGMSPPAKELERLIASHRLEHGGHPVMRWMADCVEIRQDDSGNIKPVKPDRMTSSKRIDGFPAALNALGQHLLRVGTESTPEPRIRVIGG
jgi:phage terminase large subunit-like protein